jgi:RNA polymerase sigma-70 factor (ECF subfamily)
MSIHQSIVARMCDIESERLYLMRFARKRLPDVHAAEDAVQDTLLAALTSRGSPGGFMGRSSLRTWLTAILHHKVMDVYRRNTIEARLYECGADADDVAVNAPANEADDPARQLEQKQLSATLRSAIDELPSRQRDVFVLYQMQGCSGEEIAQRVGLSSNNVWVTLHRARHALRTQLQSTDGYTDACVAQQRQFDNPQTQSRTHAAHGFSHA